MRITRTQDGRRLAVKLSYVLRELSGAQRSGFIARLHTRESQIILVTKAGIRVTYDIPQVHRWMLPQLGNIVSVSMPTYVEQLEWLSGYAGIALTQRSIDIHGTAITTEALCTQIDLINDGDGLDYFEALELLAA